MQFSFAFPFWERTGTNPEREAIRENYGKLVCGICHFSSHYHRVAHIIFACSYILCVLCMYIAYTYVVYYVCTYVYCFDNGGCGTK